jgi:DNA recombination protein RmuC
MDVLLYVTLGCLVGILAAWVVLGSRFRKLLLQKSEELNELKNRNNFLQANLDAQAKSIEDVKKQLLDTFKSAASDALLNNNRQFIEMARPQLEAQITASKGELDQRKSAIEEMLKPVRESIESYRKRIDELEKGSSDTFGQVKTLLANIQNTNASLQKETTALVNALRNPRVRGKWGEIGLRRAVEFSGMSAHCDFVEQAYTSDDTSVLKPDMIINLPGNSHVVVDSKLPLDAYLTALETDDDARRNELFAEHARSLRDHINKLSKKQYWSQFANTPDFVVLYMEVESAFNVALMTDKTLLQDAMNNKIILATPTTLVVILKSVAMSWQQHSITENAIGIMDAAEEFSSRMNTFAEHLDKVGGGLKNALKSYNDAVGSWESRIVPAARKLEQLKAAGDKNTLPGLDKIDRPVRELKKGEEE